MYTKFENLAEEKRKRIIDACIEEFSKNGYKDASTNTIVKNAGISKGILFHYFGNKKSLYLYVFEYVSDFITAIVYDRMADLSGDFFERITEIGIIKLKIAYEYSYEYKFLLSAVAQVPDDLQNDIALAYEKIYKKGMPLLMKDIDTSMFRDDIDKDKAMELVMFALEGVSNKYLKIFQSKPIDVIMSELETITKEYYQYVGILKTGIYKS